jgi:hypothetical protein
MLTALYIGRLALFYETDTSILEKNRKKYRCRQASKDAIRHNEKCLWYLSISALIF